MRASPESPHGAWRRVECVVGDQPPFETQTVIWLQAQDRYADIRVPFVAEARERCFAGQSGWEVDFFRWTHHLDLETAHGPDVGSLRWQGSDLIEEGVFPIGPNKSLKYREVWRRLPGGEGAFVAMERPGACLIRVGRHAIAVVDDRPDGGAFRAGYWVMGDDGWTVAAAIGDAGELLGPKELPDWPMVVSGAMPEVAA